MHVKPGSTSIYHNVPNGNIEKETFSQQRVSVIG